MTRDGELVSVACLGLFPTSSIITNQNNVGLNIKARFLSCQTELLPLIVEAEMMGRIAKGRRMKEAMPTMARSPQSSPVTNE